MKQISEDITVEEFEKTNKNHLIEQIFNNNIPEYIENKTPLNGKTIIVKKFTQQ